MRNAKPLAAIVENDPAAAEALSLTLRDWGADVVAAKDALEALRELGTRASSLRWIITDFDLGPGETGVESARALLLSAPEARVLMLSGDPDAALPAAQAAGFLLMEKPATSEEIVAWLEAC